MKEALEERRNWLRSRMEDVQSMKANTEVVNDYAFSFLESVTDIAQDQVYYKNYKKGTFELEEEPANLSDLLQHYQTYVAEAGLNPASGSHLGYIPGCGLYPSALGDYIAAVTNEYAGINFASPGAVRMENAMCSWMCDLIGYNEKSYGVLTEGGSAANMMAIVVAREAIDLDPADYTKQVFYLTRQTHHCLYKGIKTAGLAKAHFRFIGMDSSYRMDVDELKKAITEDVDAGLSPFMLIGNAGSTDVGVIDPLDELASIAEENNCWFHVDGAYGGGFLLVDELKKKFKGIERADSVVIDPHKGFFLPYGTGTLLVKDGKKIIGAFHFEANYMQDTLDSREEISSADASFELSRHYRGLRMWLPFRLYGIDVIRKALEEKVMLTHYFLDQINQWESVEIGNEPDLSVAIFRLFKDHPDRNELNERVVKELHLRGKSFFSSTTINGEFWIRVAVLGFRTHIDHVEQGLSEIKRAVELVT